MSHLSTVFRIVLRRSLANNHARSIDAYLLEHLNKPVTKNDACSNRDSTHQQEVTP